MTDRGYNVVIFVGKVDARFYEHVLAPFSIHTCISVCKKKEFMPHLHTAKHLWRYSHALDDIDWNTVLPLDEELIESMRECEAIFLHLSDRHEQRGSVIPYQERKRRYLQTLRYCNHILVNEHIDLFLSTSVPHLGISYTFYALCKQKGIPVLFPYHVDPLPDAFFIQDTWEDPSPMLRDHFHALRQKEKNLSELSLSPPFEQYWQLQTQGAPLTPLHSKEGEGTSRDESERNPRQNAIRPPDPRPWYLTYHRTTDWERWCKSVSELLFHHPLRFLWHVLTYLPRRLRLALLRDRLQRTLCYRRARATFHFYDVRAQEPDLSKRYLYVPLMMQPECTSVPMGGAYGNQELLVQMLNALLPEGVLLYVKEHPMQRKAFADGRCRSQTFYEDLLACKRVRFVPTHFDSYRLVENAAAVATVTGTVGIEALFREKPVLMFGHRYIQYASGVFAIRTKEDCQRALDRIFKGGEKPARSDVRLFLKAIEETCVQATVGFERLRVSRFSPEENARRAGEAFAAEIERRLAWHRL